MIARLGACKRIDLVIQDPRACKMSVQQLVKHRNVDDGHHLGQIKIMRDQFYLRAGGINIIVSTFRLSLVKIARYASN